ncbi:MAG: 2-hydroxyacid dehydrogenase [Candidatus Caenarcaniphilales bacterium]|nr:2-hydroxyacid dehydrogenase [Candidatus Caenarcaniphilales bacterium]
MQKKILVFDAKPYDTISFDKLPAVKNKELLLDYVEFKLGRKTASLAEGYDAVCVFVHDLADEQTLKSLKDHGIKLLALRCAGYNNVALKAAKELDIKVLRVPEYSPYAVAEHAVALIMSLNRNTHRAFLRVRDSNFSLNGLVGFDMHGKTVGLIGTGKIGQVAARILKGFGCKVLAYDLYKNEKAAQEIGFEYVALKELYSSADIITLHLPLTLETYHMINKESLRMMKDGVVIINTSRGQLIDTKELINGLKSGKVKAAGLDVYEEEDEYFFEDWSNQVVQDDDLARLLSFNNVLVTSHQAFFTEEALFNIADTTVKNIQAFFDGKELVNEVHV